MRGGIGREAVLGGTEMGGAVLGGAVLGGAVLGGTTVLQDLALQTNINTFSNVSPQRNRCRAE